MRRALPVLLTLAVVISGCGEDDGSGSKGEVTTPAGEPIAVRGYEYGFEPGTITVEGRGGDTQVEFMLDNDGSLPHDLHVRKGDDERGGTEVIGGGETAEAVVELPPGEYEIYCSIGDHADLGMKGELTVE